MTAELSALVDRLSFWSQMHISSFPCVYSNLKTGNYAGLNVVATPTDCCLLNRPRTGHRLTLQIELLTNSPSLYMLVVSTGHCSSMASGNQRLKNKEDKRALYRCNSLSDVPDDDGIEYGGLRDIVKGYRKCTESTYPNRFSLLKYNYLDQYDTVFPSLIVQ